jgi:putative ABC transport system permease protein
MTVKQSFKFSLRLLRKSPGFTAMAVLMLALGIGAVTSIFSIVEGVLLRPLPFPDSDQLVSLGDTFQGGNGNWGVSASEAVAYARDTHSFASVGSYKQESQELSDIGNPAMIHVTRLTGGVFPALGVAPTIGHVFTQQDDDQKNKVAVLSFATWRSRFNGNPNVLGSKILVNREPYIVIGVMPPDFEFPLTPGHANRSELWVPMSYTSGELDVLSWDCNMVARLKGGVSLVQAQADAEGVAQEIMRTSPKYKNSIHINAAVRPLRQEVVAQGRNLIRMLSLAVIVVLLIVCFNLAGLMLIRAIHRQREIALRLALGAGAFTLLAQSAIEGLLLSTGGGLLGLGVAALVLRFVQPFFPETMPLIDRIGIDWRVVVFSILLAIITGLVCSLAPAFAAIHTNVTVVLKDGGRSGTSGAGHTRLRSALVIGEIAIAMALLAASGLLLKSFEKMRTFDLGFRPDHVLSAFYTLPKGQYTQQPSIDRFDTDLQERLKHLAGVAAAGWISFLPDGGPVQGILVTVDGYVPEKNASPGIVLPLDVMGDYFSAMGIRLLRGRTFTDSDNADSLLVAIVSRRMAERYWPGQDPIGKSIRWSNAEAPTRWMTVVGEVEDVTQSSPDEASMPQVYQPLAQERVSYGGLITREWVAGEVGYFVIRTPLPPEQMMNAMISAFRSVDPQLSPTRVETMEQAILNKEQPRRFNTGIITIFAAVAMGLALLGIYSVIAFSAASRTQEMAIRAALGSGRAGIVGLILASGAKMAGAGCVLGLLGALAASSLIRAFLFDVSPYDPLVLALSAICIFLLALVVSFFPGRKAASIEPMQALRAD